MRTQINKDLTFLKDIEIAHRGLWNTKFPENSIGAFKNSIGKNLPIELDVHLLKDNTLVVFHDDNLKRMTGQNLQIKDCNYEDIKKLKLLNTEYTIPTFEEVLQLVNGKVLIDIEIKTDVNSFKVCKKLCELLKNYEGPILIKSFNPIFIAWFRFHKSYYTRGLLVSKLKNVKINKLIKYICYKMHLNFLVKPDFIAFNLKDLPNRKIEKLYSKGVPILLWTVNKNESIEYKYSGIIFEDK